MNLLIDIGNTRIKWCWLDSGKLMNFQALPHTDNLNVTLYTIWAKSAKPSNILIGCVATPATLTIINSVILQLWNCKPTLIQIQQNVYGVAIGYDNINQLGIDRWLAMLAARQRYINPIIVVDCGTAVTIDVLNETGQHLGGLIIPGLNLLWKTIFNNTAIMPIVMPLKFGMLGLNTGECIAAGSLQAIAGAIELTYNRVNTTMNAPSLILTGGDAITIAKRLSVPYIIISELVLEGLVLFAN